MAEGPDPVVADLEQEVTCGICHDHYQEPKLFPCCHYYCKQCILTLSSRYRPNQPFPCPDCREPTLLPDNDPDKLPTAFFINRMKELHSRMEKAHGKMDATCEMCSRGKATAFCRQCVNFICSKCVESHQYMKVFADHVISTLEELKQGGLKELIVKIPKPSNCEDHDEPKKIFCFDCRDCAVFDHHDHKSEFVKTSTPDTRNNLTEHLTPLKSLLPDLTTAVKQVRDTKQQVQAQKKITEKAVNTKFQELHDILERCKARVLRECSALADSKMEKLTIEENGLNLSMDNAQSLIDFVERTLDNASDEELITMQEQVVSRIDAEVVKRGKEAVGAHPVENASFGAEVLVAEELEKLCENNVVVHEGLPVVFGAGIKMAEVDSCARFSIFSGSNESRPQATLKSLVDGSSQQLQVAPVGRGVYNVEYTPKTRGQHHLLISVDNQPIPGSPFSVLVKIHPTKLDKPVRKIDRIDPWYGTFNSSGEFIVADNTTNNFFVLDKKGKIGCTDFIKHEFEGACGVAVDKEDNIYISDKYINCVYKFSEKGNLLKKFGKEGSGPKELNSPRGIAVTGDRVLVCDNENRRVQVLTTELEPVDVIEGLYDPYDIAVDDEQMFYIADGNQGVQVFTVDGQFSHCFEQEQLRSTRGICVDGGTGFVYVSDCGNGCVCVFTRDGQFVTSFGKGGYVNGLHGITVDSDGFVYVCHDTAVTVF